MTWRTKQKYCTCCHCTQIVTVTGVIAGISAHDMQPGVSPGEQQHPEVLREGDECVPEGEGAAGAHDGRPLPANQVGHRTRRQAPAQHAERGYAH